jgi:hypothetical protein
MSFPRKQTLTAASVVARRRNALKSTGPRTPQGKARAALNSFKHGLRSKSFRQTLQRAGEPTDRFDLVLDVLAGTLKPRNQLEVGRAVRYAQMLLRLRYRMEKNRRERRRHAPLKFPVVLSKAERAHQNRVMKDLKRAWARTTYKARRRAGPMIRLITFTGWIPDAAPAKPRNGQTKLECLLESADRLRGSPYSRFTLSASKNPGLKFLNH